MVLSEFVTKDTGFFRTDIASGIDKIVSAFFRDDDPVSLLYLRDTAGSRNGAIKSGITVASQVITLFSLLWKFPGV